ncbi:MAG: SH3 domain-containing protein [Clostridia bacterium]|nr:SH3 domain-containing protein [Clostridia bacterium]
MFKRFLAFLLTFAIVFGLCTAFALETDYTTPSAKGIDVSSHQENIDWETVKNEVDFAIIRCGYGQDLINQDDTRFAYNADECTRLGIPFGVYLYSYADSLEKAHSEAEHALRLIEGYKLSLPVFFDMEDSKLLNVSAKMRGQIATIFCDTVSDAGYDVGIYANTNWWNTYLTDSAFDNTKWTKWVAQYYSSCTYQGDYSCWQYTSSGKVNGIDGKVDLNYWYGEPYFLDKSSVLLDYIDEDIFSQKLADFRKDLYDTDSEYQNNDADSVGYQSFGYANFLSNYVFGSFPATDMSGVDCIDEWKISYGGNAIDDLHIGDIVRYGYHSIFITEIDGDDIYYTDANADGDNVVIWDNCVNKNILKIYVRQELGSGPSAIDGQQYTGWVAHYKGWDIEAPPQEEPDAPIVVPGIDTDDKTDAPQENNSYITPEGYHGCKECAVIEKSGYVDVSSTLNVRSGPGTTYERITYLSPNALVNISAECSGWYFVTASDSKMGWVSGEYIVVYSDDDNTDPDDNDDNVDTDNGNTDDGTVSTPIDKEFCDINGDNIPMLIDVMQYACAVFNADTDDLPDVYEDGKRNLVDALMLMKALV